MFNLLKGNFVISNQCLMVAMALFLLTFAIFSPSISFAQEANAQVQVTLDPNFHTPAPPNDAFPPNPQHVMVGTTAMTMIALVMVVISIVEGKRFKSTVPFALVIAAVVCVIPESVDNYLAGCFWSQSHDPNQIFFFLMGREFDYYVISMWWAFGAVLGYLLYAVLLRNVKTGTLWLTFFVSGIADILFEETLLRYGGIYTYFGHQPLVLLGNFPFWWMTTNVAALFLTVAIAYRYKEWLNGWKSILLLLLMPVCYIGGFSFAAMPTIFVIQGDFSPVVTQLGGLLTVILSVVETAGIMGLILKRNPFALRCAPNKAEFQ